MYLCMQNYTCRLCRFPKRGRYIDYTFIILSSLTMNDKTGVLFLKIHVLYVFMAENNKSNGKKKITENN
jgi:hypothetical protein